MSVARRSLFAALVGVAVIARVALAQGARVVTPEHVKFLLSTLAHDSMEGRGTGTPGSMRAAKFIAEQFRLAGLEPAGDSGFFQHVPMVNRSIDRSSALTVDGTTLRLGSDFSVSPGRADPASLDGVPVIFGGVFGDTANALTADQVRGKLVIFTPAPPPTNAGGRGRAPAAASCRDVPVDSAARGGRRGGMVEVVVVDAGAEASEAAQQHFKARLASRRSKAINSRRALCGLRRTLERPS